MNTSCWLQQWRGMNVLEVAANRIRRRAQAATISVVTLRRNFRYQKRQEHPLPRDL